MDPVAGAVHQTGKASGDASRAVAVGAVPWIAGVLGQLDHQLRWSPAPGVPCCLCRSLVATSAPRRFWGRSAQRSRPSCCGRPRRSAIRTGNRRLKTHRARAWVATSLGVSSGMLDDRCSDFAPQIGFQEAHHTGCGGATALPAQRQGGCQPGSRAWTNHDNMALMVTMAWRTLAGDSGPENGRHDG